MNQYIQVLVYIVIAGLLYKLGIKILEHLDKRAEVQKKKMEKETDLLQTAIKNLVENQNKMNISVLSNLDLIREYMKQTKELISTSVRNSLGMFFIFWLATSIFSPSVISSAKKEVLQERQNMEVLLPKPTPVKTCDPPCTGNTYCNSATGKCESKAYSPPVSGFNFADLDKVGNDLPDHWTYRSN